MATVVTTTSRRLPRFFRSSSDKPVRLQFMRWDEHGWDNYGPAHVGEIRAAADADGKIVAYQYDGWHHNWSAIETSAQLALGTPAAEWRLGAAQQVNPSDCGGMYDIPNVRLVNHQVPGLKYLKGAWLRSPLDLSFSFASEQTIDELARLVGMDAYEFRQRNITRRALAGRARCCRARAAKWEPRPPASNSFRREDRTRPWHRTRHTSHILWRRRRRNRSEQGNWKGRGEAHVWRDRRRASP